MRLKFLALFVLSLHTSALAGPYSSYSGTTPGAIDNPIQKSTLTVFESSVVNYAPAPGVGPSFRNPAGSGITSLGELYSPVTAPGGVNTPFNRLYAPQTGTKPNAFHAGSGSATNFNGNVNDSTDSYGFVGIDQPGSITLGFGNRVIRNGAGADFAVFENAFALGGPTSLLAELAYVEVSSNGVNFLRFPAVSLNTAPTGVSGAFQGYDATNIYNLAGKHISGWGTPFDLDSLVTLPDVLNGTVDLNAISFVRLVDVVGTGALDDGFGNPLAGVARDSLGNPILDNWLTYDSAGFDYLGTNTGAVGLVNFATVPEPGTWAILAGVGILALASRRRSSQALAELVAPRVS